MIQFACPESGKNLSVKEHLAGKKGKCPHCGAAIAIPGRRPLDPSMFALALQMGGVSMNRPIFWLAILAACLLEPVSAGDDKPIFEKKVHTDAKKNKLPYRLLLPDNYDAKQTYPLILFLHGSGERGTDNDKQLVTGARDLATKKLRKNLPCFVVAPQCSGKEPLDYWLPTVNSGLVLGMLKDLEKRYSIDPKRIYLTGISDGGWGVWRLLALYPDKFAAAVPICGRGNPGDAPTIAKTPVWIFHGAKDDIEPVKSSREMLTALKKAGGNPKYTEYPNEGHFCWGTVYRDPKMFLWMFAQKRK
jgi:predicted peptidase